MKLYTQIQNAKYQHINSAEIFNSGLHDSFLQIDFMWGGGIFAQRQYDNHA